MSADALCAPAVLPARVTHRRRTPTANAFTYTVDYLILPACEGAERRPLLFSRDRFNLISWRSRDHGVGPRRGHADWADGLMDARGVAPGETCVVSQPRYWGYVFNPISLWMRFRNGDGALLAVAVEVNNTFGDRHCYLCLPPPGEAVIRPDHWLTAEKQMHVSPYFEVKGGYRFRFSMTERRFDLWIAYDDGDGGGLFTAMHGLRRPLSNRTLFAALVRRPFGAMKSTALIYWQALKLRWKGVVYRRRPAAPEKEISE